MEALFSIFSNVCAQEGSWALGEELLPFCHRCTGLYVGGDFNGLVVSNDKLIDAKVNIGWESSFGLGIEAGYRSYTLEYDDSDDFADLTIDGAYAGVFYHF